MLCPCVALAAEQKMPADFVALARVDSSIIQDIRFSGRHNFVGRPLDGYLSANCILTKAAATALAAVQAELKAQKLSLLVYDCYRPQRAVDDYLKWQYDAKDLAMKDEFYPEMGKGDIFRRGYLQRRSSHTRGSTVDLTLVPLPYAGPEAFRAGQKLKACDRPTTKRFNDHSLDMGTGVGCFSPRSNSESLEINAVQRANRQLLSTLMGKHGFHGFRMEWWHYVLNIEPYPDRYFDFPIR